MYIDRCTVVVWLFPPDEAYARCNIKRSLLSSSYKGIVIVLVPVFILVRFLLVVATSPSSDLALALAIAIALALVPALAFAMDCPTEIPVGVHIC